MATGLVAGQIGVARKLGRDAPPGQAMIRIRRDQDAGYAGAQRGLEIVEQVEADILAMVIAAMRLQQGGETAVGIA